MASDLISRSALLDLYDGLEGKGLRIPIDVLILNIEDQPTVDAVEVVHGEWINLSDTYTWFRCSVCEKYQDVTHNYCPNCGAKMDGDLDD